MADNDIIAIKEVSEGAYQEIALAASDLKLGTTSGLPIKTGSGGVLEAGSFGTSAGTFCEGNDARLSDARTPSSTLAHAASHELNGADILELDQLGSSNASEVGLSLLGADGPNNNVWVGPGSVLSFGQVTHTIGASGSGVIIDGEGITFDDDTVQTTAWAGGAITSSGLTQATARILGRTTASTGAVEELTVSGGASLSAGALTVHAQSHAITSASDHTAGSNKIFYSDNTGAITELALGANGTVLTSNGTTSAPTFAAAAAPSNMTGATSSTAGAAGLVPQPAAGNEEKALLGSGEFHFPLLPVIKSETTRGTNVRRWLVAPFAQDQGAGSTGGANFEFCGGYVYIPYTGSFYYATIPAAAYSGSTKTCWALYNLASDGLPSTLAYDLGELDVGAGSGVLCESANSVSLNKGWYCCVSRANASFNLWSPQSTNWMNYIVGRPTSLLTTTSSDGKRRFYRSLTYSTSFSSDLTSQTFTEDTNTPPNLFFRRA